ncbi:MAG TPA: glycosyltransferase [Polyangiales bacterium]
MLDDTGIVVIARNEGERFRRCLASLQGAAKHIVYADSGSSDGSAEHARAEGAEVVVIEPPYNQPRGRNAGLRRLLELDPELRYVFFLDGDCQLVPGFLQAAHAALEKDAGAAAACGRRLELHPDASVYNKLVHMEWNTKVGEGDFGGDVLIRAEVVRALGGYRENMPAGEDMELSYRVRAAGHRVLRLPLDMTTHDVALARFGSWWKRHGRGGQAFAHAMLLNWGSPERYGFRTCASILAHGAALPAACIALAPPTLGASLAVYLADSARLAARVRRTRMREHGDNARDASVYGAFVALGKVAEAQGVVEALWKHLLGQRMHYVEYKDYQEA